jgi:hypothetical protein
MLHTTGREQIKSALEAYRSYIMASNRRALETLIPIIANWMPEEDSDFFEDMTKDDVPRIRLKSLSQLLGFDSVVRRLSDPTELLTRWEELAPLLELDGVARLYGPSQEEEEDEDGVKYPLLVLADQEYRELKFNEYVTAVEAALRDRVVEEARDTVAFPEELRILFELGVDGLSGCGLPIWQAQGCGCHFWTGLGEEPIEDVVSRVQGPDTQLGAWGGTIRESFDLAADYGEEWVVAGGWGIGRGNDAQTCYAVFCRRADEEEFAWRYAIICESVAYSFDTIPQLLDCYKDFEQIAMDYHLECDADERILFDSGVIC